MTNHAKVGGILSIISGVFGILEMFLFIFMIYLFQFMATSDPGAFATPEEQMAFQFMSVYFGAIGVFFAIFGVLAIIGGIYALKKKLWGLALTGAIAGTLTFLPTGIPAIIFTAMGKREFNPPTAVPMYAPVPPTPPPTAIPPTPPAA